MKIKECVKLFVSNLLGSEEQDIHDEILRKYTLPVRVSVPRIGEDKA